VAESEEALRGLLEFQAFLFDLSRTFIGLPEETVDVNMVQGLARVGEFLRMDRITILELTEDREGAVVAYSWAAPGVPDPTPRITRPAHPWWRSQVLLGNVLLTANVDDIPDNAALEREYLRGRGVRSIASIPLRVGGEIAGAISFVTVRRQESWSPELLDQLRAVGDILWNALKRRKAMQELLAAQALVRESEERFRLVADTAPVIIWMSDADKQWTFVNSSWARLTGQMPEGALGGGWIGALHPEDADRVGALYAGAYDRREPFELECRVRRYDGKYRWVLANGVPRFDANRSFAGYTGSAKDVTERKAAEDVLSTLSQRLIEAQERERARLARELHDDINQRLALLALGLEAIRQRPEVSTSDVGRDIGNAVAAVMILTTDVQSLSHRLHSSQLRLLGLEAAARGLCEELSERTPVDVQFHTETPLVDLSEEVSLCLYRVLQEALQNAIKHSQSPRIEARLRTEAGYTELSVRDWGVGFEPASALNGAGLGLVGMKERLKLVGGDVTIESRTSAGTTIRARVPLSSRGA
jgi:PAS domain S-box-containing protein